MKESMTQNTGDPKAPNWNAVWSLTIGVCGLIIAEFLPAGMLTPMAKDLGISEGMAGQAVTATSIFAVATSLLIAFLTRKFNRRTVLLSLSMLLGLSSLIAALRQASELFSWDELSSEYPSVDFGPWQRQSPSGWCRDLMFQKPWL